MAAKNSHKAKKGKNPDSIRMNTVFIESVLAEPEKNQRVISDWKSRYQEWPKALKNALSKRGITL